MKTFFKRFCGSCFFCLVIVGSVVSLGSCNVTRVVSTQSSYVQHGDTTTQIITKTIESYDASKR